VTVFFGRPYSCCHEGWGSAFMTKHVMPEP
jgi:hypothetical protein